MGQGRPYLTPGILEAVFWEGRDVLECLGGGWILDPLKRRAGGDALLMPQQQSLGVRPLWAPPRFGDSSQQSSFCNGFQASPTFPGGCFPPPYREPPQIALPKAGHKAGETIQRPSQALKPPPSQGLRAGPGRDVTTPGQ